MPAKGTEYLKPEQAHTIGLTNSAVIVTRLDEPLLGQINSINQVLHDAVPGIDQHIIQPVPHLTFCWITPNTSEENVERSLDQWKKQNVPFRIGMRGIFFYPGRFGIPYIGIKRTREINSRRNEIISFLKENDVQVIDPVWRRPHVSLLYYLPNTPSEIANRVATVLRHPQEKFGAINVSGVDYVQFDSKGRQSIVSL